MEDRSRGLLTNEFHTYGLDWIERWGELRQHLPAFKVELHHSQYLLLLYLTFEIGYCNSTYGNPVCRVNDDTQSTFATTNISSRLFITDLGQMVMMMMSLY